MRHLALIAVLFPLAASAQTNEELAQKLADLEAQVKALKAQNAQQREVPVVQTTTIEEAPDADSMPRVSPEQLKEGGDQQLRFLAYFFTKGEVSNVAPQNDLLQGRLVGVYGPNTTAATGDTTVFAEQRLIPFMIFEPKILGGFARLRASFEINWTWGDSSYGVGGNFGAALSGRGVNLQTQNINVEIRLARTWHVTIGLQRLWDNIRDPYRTFASTIFQTGNRLAFWGTDAVGISVLGYHRGTALKLGVYDLYENKIQKDDNVLLFEALTSHDFGRAVTLGAHARYLRDTSSGVGGVSVLGQGPNSRLAEYNGVFRFPLGDAPFEAHVVWLGLDVAWNPELVAGRWGGSAFVTGNFGTIIANGTTAADIAGLAANVRLACRWGRSKGSHIAADLIYTSGDGNGINDGLYTGVLTGNTWGAPAAIFVGHGAYLLMPHSNVVNRLSTAVFDISNVGYGLTAGTLNFSADILRNVLTAKIGVAAGASNIAPPGGGHFIGFEANASLVYRPRVWLTVEAHGAYLNIGDFYDSPAINTIGMGVRPSDPWMAMLAIKWLMF